MEYWSGGDKELECWSTGLKVSGLKVLGSEVSGCMRIWGPAFNSLLDTGVSSKLSETFLC